MKLSVLMFVLPLALGAQTGASNSSPNTPAAPSPSAETLVSLTGKILNGLTEEPVQSATLLLIGPQTYTAKTDADGKFSVADIPPGQYRLNADRTGFSKPAYAGRRFTGYGSLITLDRAHAPGELILHILPHGVISGRITGLDDEPMVRAQVQIMRLIYFRNGKALNNVGTVNTNDLGEYRVFGLAPGKYFVGATIRPAVEYSPVGLNQSARARAEEQYVQTYYPGVADAAAGTQVEVAAGSQLTSIDIRLARAQTVPVKGRVTMNDLPEGIRSALLYLSPHLDPRAPGRAPMRVAYPDAKGGFEFPGVPPGGYDLLASVNHTSRTYSARVQIEVSHDPVENLVLAIGPGLTLNGQVHVEGDAAPPSNFRIRLPRSEPHLPNGVSIVAPAKPDGTFAISDVSPDRYEVQVVPYPRGYYLKSIRAGDRDVLHSGLDLTGGVSAPLEVVLSPGAGEIRGIVLNSDSKPTPNAVAVLVPKEKELRDSPASYRRSTADQQGSFVLAAIPPGDYKLFAWESMDDFAYLDPEFLKPIEGKSEAITVRESSAQTVQVRAMDSE